MQMVEAYYDPAIARYRLAGELTETPATTQQADRIPFVGNKKTTIVTLRLPPTYKTVDRCSKDQGDTT